MIAYFALLLTLGQLAAIGIAYAQRIDALFANVVIHGSPFTLIVNMFNQDSAFNGPKLYLLFMAYHVIKYLSIWRAKSNGEYPGIVATAIASEIAYLCVSAYYLY